MPKKLFRCPVCVAAKDSTQGDFTHHGAVEIYNRQREDSRDGTSVRVDGSQIWKDTDVVSRNPSARRDGIRIEFRCESYHKFDLLIEQHKGNTYFSIWSYDLGAELAPLLINE